MLMDEYHDFSSHVRARGSVDRLYALKSAGREKYVRLARLYRGEAKKERLNMGRKVRLERLVRICGYLASLDMHDINSIGRVRDIVDEKLNFNDSGRTLNDLGQIAIKLSLEYSSLNES